MTAAACFSERREAPLPYYQGDLEGEKVVV